MKYADFEPGLLRFVVFTPTVKQLATARVMGGLLSRFTGDPMVLPIPDDAPGEIPRIALREPREGMELQIALARSDLQVIRRPGVEFRPPELVGASIDVIEQLLDVLGTRPARLAVIGSYFARVDDPAAALALHFCKPQWTVGPMKQLGTLEVHALRQDELLEGLTVNSWIRCKTGTVAEGGQMSHPAVVVERDVNTLPQEAEQRSFSQDDVRSFMVQATEFLWTEIQQFFPAEEQS